jgi:ribose-phosphate pyrophosphokinase
MPYQRFMRQERKDESRTSITTRAIAKILNEEHNRVLTLDIHSDAIPGSFRIPYDPLYSFPTVIKYLGNEHPDILKNLVVISPDVGGGKRAEAFSKRVNGRDVVIGYKVRPNAGDVGKLRLRKFGGRQVLIVDDILDSGGTLIEAAKAARRQGAERVYGYVTHPLFTKGYEKVVRAFDRLFIGNTVSHPCLARSRKVEVISFTELFGEAIYRTNRHDSISALFN